MLSEVAEAHLEPLERGQRDRGGGRLYEVKRREGKRRSDHDTDVVSVDTLDMERRAIAYTWKAMRAPAPRKMPRQPSSLTMRATPWKTLV